ncbi:MAG: sulfatase-like hydrolase/transferase [Halioglobus sp.]|nr:sulfatase-like hydrolase/transferase [Halioglobus sp.]
MLSTRAVLAGGILSLLCGCYHPIQVVGEGDVISMSGSRNCLREDFQAGAANCTQNLVVGDYVETYSGVARPGWQFRRWGNYCGTALNNECAFNVPAATVELGVNLTMPALQAVFRKTENTGFTSLFIGQTFMGTVAAGIEAHAEAAGFADHHSTTFTRVGALGAPQAFWNNQSQRQAVQAVLNTGKIELFGMSYDPAHPGTGGYKSWINYALGKNPDTRFFIATPWPADPTALDIAQYAAKYQSTELAVNTLVDSLRATYPGVDIYAVPYGRAAVELYSLYGAGNLPQASNLVGPGTVSVFQDAQGNPGDMLATLGQLVWLGAIYAVDLASYSYESGYTTDVKALAQTILSEQKAKYRAPPEVDVDTDGDGIVDRLDPNPSGKPNILVLMADDLGFNDLAINNGNSGIDTPHMDQLAREGTRFTRHYAAAVCSPGRAAFLTGLYPERVGYLPNALGISPEIVTLPERLRQEGYTTWHIGKWHVGDLERTAWPDHQGFDHWFGFLNQWRLAGLHVDGELKLTQPRYQDPWLEGDSEAGRNFSGHLENILTEKAIDVLTDLSDMREPWFLNLWFYAPHGPVQPASEFAALYPDTSAGRFQALVNQLDTNIGLILAHLEALGELEETIVVLVSDNGGTNSVLDNNSPFVGVKTQVSEGGLRTPLVIRWPDASINGRVVSDAVGIEDLYPTLLSAIGETPPPNLDGKSFYHELKQQLPLPQRERFWEMGRESHGVLSADSRWRLFQSYPLWGIQVEPVIFDMELDPTAGQYLVPTPPERLALMNGAYLTWYKDVHTVRTEYVPGANGTGVLTGMDFLRTPGFGGYTFGIGIPDALEGQIAAQEGIWGISRSGESVTVQLGEIILSGDIETDNSCHTVVVIGDFNRYISSNSGPDHIMLALYIDGTEVQSVAYPSRLPVSDPTIETVIGDPWMPSNVDSLAPPVIVNTVLSASTPWTMEAFSSGLCGAP